MSSNRGRVRVTQGRDITLALFISIQVFLRLDMYNNGVGVGVTIFGIQVFLRLDMYNNGVGVTIFGIVPHILFPIGVLINRGKRAIKVIMSSNRGGRGNRDRGELEPSSLQIISEGIHRINGGVIKRHNGRARTREIISTTRRQKLVLKQLWGTSKELRQRVVVIGGNGVQQQQPPSIVHLLGFLILGFLILGFLKERLK
jgi:hypothetical protein